MDRCCVFFFVLLVFYGTAAQDKLNYTEWVQNFTGRSDRFLSWLIEGCPDDTGERCTNKLDNHREFEQEGYDGWYNNLALPSLGAIDTPLLRILPADYSDGVYEPANRKANPLDVSQELMAGNSGLTSKVGRTAFQLFFGQQVVEEILDAQRPACPPEYFNIKIPSSKSEYSNLGPELPLLRTRFDSRTGTSPNNPRQQLNEITPYLDGGLIYGTSKGWTDILRTTADGTPAPSGQLAYDKYDDQFPEKNVQRLPHANPPPPTFHERHIKNGFTEDVDRLFKLGNPRGNENPFLLTFGILWFRWHNVIAKFLKKKYKSAEPSVTDERIFNEARKWVIATQQAIVMLDWLPTYLGTEMDEYYSTSSDGVQTGGYDPSVNPQVSHVFQSAAMRFGHTLVTSGVYFRQRNGMGCKAITKPKPNIFSLGEDSKGIRTCNSYFRAEELFDKDYPENFENLILGLSAQSTEREDNIIVEDLRGNVFGPLEFSRRDLMAINIQRGRDHGLPSYNTARKYFNLPVLKELSVGEFETKTGTALNDTILQKLVDAYDGRIDQVDIWAGGILETNDGPGQLFTAVIKDQFRRIRHGDRFWFENKNNGLFKDQEIARLKQMKIIDIVLSVSQIDLDDIQLNPFLAPHGSNEPLGASCQDGRTEHDCRINGNDTKCYYLPQLDNSTLDQCTQPETYDYFTGSHISYILTFFFTGLLCIGLLFQVKVWTLNWGAGKSHHKNSTPVNEGAFKFKERVSRFENRTAIITFHPTQRKILVEDVYGKTLRIIDTSHLSHLVVSHLPDYTNLVLTADNHYDLFMVFKQSDIAQQFFDKLQCSIRGVGGAQVNIIAEEMKSRSQLTANVKTVKDREKEVAHFTSFVLMHVFDKETVQMGKFHFLSEKKKNSFYNLNLTRVELAEAVGMETDSIFLSQLFLIMDTDKSGFISFNEFLHVILIFNKGTIKEKARLYFDIYDVDQSGYLTSEDFYNIVKPNIKNEFKQGDLNSLIKNMLNSIGLQHQDKITFEQFYEVLKNDKTFTGAFGINVENESTKEDSKFSIYRSFSRDKVKRDTDNEVSKKFAYKIEQEPSSVFKTRWCQISNKIKSNQQYVFWYALYTIVMLLIFAERSYYYSTEREHAGLRQIAGYGVTVTRGAASAIMFTYSTILVTMCRNTFSILRSSPVHSYFPFDNMIEMHKYIGWWALFWTAMHVVGHAINFYHISTQTASDLSCLFRDFFRATHVLPKFHYWCWQTITGLTGVILTLLTAVIYIFAYFARQKMFKLFWLTHNSYPLFYLLLILHGSGNLVQEPLFHFFFLGPCVLFIIDKLVSVSRNNIEIDIARVTHLPSKVTLLHIRRPPNFSFLSGQWIRLACTGISKQEFHPFTLSSAPHENYLTLHIRGVGPWTNALRKKCPDYNDIKNDNKFMYSKVLIDGPFGEGHQTWSDYEVVVFIGGGIGVTPFASILKDIVHKSKQAFTTFKCKRVMFLWVTRSQKQFEWMTDILSQVEEADELDIIRIHIFITQFKSKFDLRSFLIYMAERHFQKVSGKSMFTGLRGITHFARPNFNAVFHEIKKLYKDVNVVGVFTCGNPSLSAAVEEGCQRQNKTDGPVLKHYYENF